MAEAAAAASSFSGLRAYGRALWRTPERLRRRAWSAPAAHEETGRVRARSGGGLRKSLRWPDLVALGLGGMVGAGVFVTTGRAARLYAGPGLVISYAIAGLCALLSAFCYTEFAVEIPLAGGAFSYILVTFGEFPAFVAGSNLVMDYVFSNAAVARSFTAYLGTAIGVSTTDKWRLTVTALPEGFNQLDFLAVGVILVITLVICRSTKESASLNMSLTVLHLAFILFIIVGGFLRGNARNLYVPAEPDKSPGGFLPMGIKGVFDGAAMVYLSYIGYDAVSTMAEETEEPRRDIPAGVSGSVALVTLLYCLMAASMAMLVPYDAIDVEAPFSSAFRDYGGWPWAANVIGAGASLGILTSLLVAMLGQARYLCVIGRSTVLPPWLAEVNAKTSTPVNASASLGAVTAAIALFTELNVLLNLVTIGTLFVFYLVANAVVYRRYATAGTGCHHPTAALLAGISALSLCFTLVWHFGVPGKVKVIVLALCMGAAVASLQIFRLLVGPGRKPELWGVPLMPWTPAASIFLNVFLLGSLDGPSYARFGAFSLLIVLVYVFYSVHASYDAEKNAPLDGTRDADDLKV